jgi:hypothetical protein
MSLRCYIDGTQTGMSAMASSMLQLQRAGYAIVTSSTASAALDSGGGSVRFDPCESW